MGCVLGALVLHARLLRTLGLRAIAIVVRRIASRLAASKRKPAPSCVGCRLWARYKAAWDNVREEGRHGMCVRFYTLTMEEAESVLSAHAGESRALTQQNEFNPVHDAHLGSMIPAYLPDKTGALKTASLTWGFPLEG